VIIGIREGAWAHPRQVASCLDCDLLRSVVYGSSNSRLTYTMKVLNDTAVSITLRK
jgi:hypothetical protein